MLVWACSSTGAGADVGASSERHIPGSDDTIRVVNTACHGSEKRGDGTQGFLFFPLPQSTLYPHARNLDSGPVVCIVHSFSPSLPTLQVPEGQDAEWAQSITKETQGWAGLGWQGERSNVPSLFPTPGPRSTLLPAGRTTFSPARAASPLNPAPRANKREGG